MYTAFDSVVVLKNPFCQLLMSIPGIDYVLATVLYSVIGCQFKSEQFLLLDIVGVYVSIIGFSFFGRIAEVLWLRSEI